MNVFLIPSWYPDNNNKLSGIFTYEQAKSICEIDKNINLIVSLWGQEDSGYLNNKLYLNIKKIIWYFRSPKNLIKQENNYFEITNPTLHWTKKLPFGGINRLIRINKKNFLLAEKKIGKIDIIHAHVSYPAGFIAYKLATEFNIPYVITEHMAPFPFKTYLKNGQVIEEIKLAINNANEVIAVSPFLMKEIESYNLKQPVVIPNLVDENLFYPNYNRNENKFVFLTIASINDRKGIDLLIYAIKKWNPTNDNILFKIVGTGDDIDKYKKLAKNLEINHLIIWVGELDRANIPKYFRNSDSFVLFSRYETFGVVYAEAIASGIPIIATPCGGPEYIFHESIGILTENFEIENLSYSLKYMFENYSKYDKELIRNYFLNRFSQKVVTNKIIQLYNTLLI